MKKLLVLFIILSLMLPMALATEATLEASTTSRSAPAPMNTSVASGVTLMDGGIYILNQKVLKTEKHGDNLLVYMDVRFSEVRHSPDAELEVFPDNYQLVSPAGRVLADGAYDVLYDDEDPDETYNFSISAYGGATFTMKLVFEGMAQHKDKAMMRYEDSMTKILMWNKPKALELNTAWFSLLPEK